MKCKKALSVLLAFVMVLGLLPLSAMAVTTEETLAEVTGGTYVDQTADPGKSYEYTITGTDGSVQKVTVPAATAETGNGITEQTSTGEVYYQKAMDPQTAEDGIYLLVYEANGQSYAVNHTPDPAPVTVEQDKISGEQASCEWNLTYDPNDELDQYIFETNGEYLSLFAYWNSPVHGDMSRERSGFLGEAYDEQGGLTLHHLYTSAYLRGSEFEIAGDRQAPQTFYLYQKMTEPAHTQYTVTTAGLDELLAQSYTESEYTESTWKTYADAKAAAETAKDALHNPYAAKTTADAALSGIDNATRALDAAIKGLIKKPVQPIEPDVPVEPGRCVKPEITWHRTWETGYRYEKPVQEVRHLEDKAPWLNISWDWNQVKDLTASDPNPWNAEGGHAATWNKGYEGDWTDSSVRRFTGTFTWPEGVGMDATMTLQSVNDSDYEFIYDYINADPALKERYGSAKVLPINDDMYVFISKVSDGEPSSWKTETAKRHLAFWTGTTGKGIWSQHGNTGNDWGRKTPAVFQSTSATPAYHGCWPNLVDRGEGSNANVQNWDLHGQPNPMAHTDTWYTLTDTNALKSKLNELYGAAADLGGQEMRIDIYAFDNSASGGMDELELVLCTPEATTAQVQVDYWLDQTGSIHLGSSVMTKGIGEVVNLPNGTNSNELNYQKAEAIGIAGASADVSNGEQQEKDFVVQKDGNVINVVYTRKIQGVKYFTYDFGVENQYIYKDENTSAIKRVSVECRTGDTIDATFQDHDITLTYTPQDALGSFVSATLVVERRNSTNRYPIGFIPASNVLYEENFINGAWDKTEHAAMTVSDNGETVYGYTDRYDAMTGANGAYTASISASSKKTPSDLKFSFRGLGLDLIGSCGPDYGTLVVKIMQGAKVVKSYVVNTRFVNEIHQVPLLHVQKDLEAGKQYDVTIRGIYQAPPAAVSTMSVVRADSAMSAMTPELYDTLLDMGLTEDEIQTKVEFVNAADTVEAVPARRPMLMAQPLAAAGEQTVSVDSFRVYRSTEKAAPAYAEAEKNLNYTNVMDQAITGNFSAYVESDEQGGFSTADYESKGGPENELYLEPGTGIVFRTDGNYAQVSLRAVDGAAAYNHHAVSSNTEMYYELPVENGLITIANTGSDLLAVGNLKTNGAVKSISDKEQAVRAVAMMFSAPVDPEEPEQPEGFVPQEFHAEITVGTGILKRCTISITTSLDVEKLMIDGKAVKPDNQRRVNKGKDTQYVFEKSKRLRKGDTPRFEVVVYNENGVASETMLIEK